MLKLNNITCSYGKVLALDDVSIHVEKGALVSILGANGAGKSSCLKAISRLLKLQAGQLLFQGNDITKSTPEQAVHNGIIQVPEGRMIFPDLTVTENLTMGAYCRKDKKEIQNDLEKMNSYFPILKDRRRQIASTLSGGEQQMLAIARGLMARPKILLLDEPSLGLAPVIVEDIFSFLLELKQAGTTILLVEQNAFMALQIADYAYVLETGKVTLEGQGKELLENERVRESYLGIKKSK
ncbi:MAG: ABC transporter ATP-binding protein [Spirochaetales bacterium]|nr:ABC transporter ATP-binding protein [Spirochaetales bacterium]